MQLLYELITGKFPISTITHLYVWMKFCVMLGLRCYDTVQYLKTMDDIIINACTLRRMLKRMGQHRGRNESSVFLLIWVC